MSITPDLIPHSQFHKGAWLRSVYNPGWYYFLKGETNHEVTNRVFLESVDEPLKELVRLLHQHGIQTTPSCAGHHFGKNSFEKIYDLLLKDQEMINRDGLVLEDIETSRLYYYRDEHYTLPWDRKIFLKRVKDYQTKGVLGIRLNRKTKLRNLMLNLHVNGLSIYEEDGIVFIRTVQNENGDHREEWERVTSEVKRIMKAVGSMQEAGSRRQENV